MNELIKILKNFIVRDIIYITGGLFVILSCLYPFKETDIFSKETSIFFSLCVIVVGYVIGYGIQELFCLLFPFAVSTSASFKPGLFTKLLYKWYMHKEWNENLKEFDEAKASIEINKCKEEDVKASWHRIINLTLISTVIGPCSIISGLILLQKRSVPGYLEWLIIAFGVFFLILGRIKLAQLKEMTSKIFDSL